MRYVMLRDRLETMFYKHFSHSVRVLCRIGIGVCFMSVHVLLTIRYDSKTVVAVFESFADAVAYADVHKVPSWHIVTVPYHVGEKWS